MKTWSTNISTTDLDRRWSRRNNTLTQHICCGEEKQADGYTQMLSKKIMKQILHGSKVRLVAKCFKHCVWTKKGWHAEVFCDGYFLRWFSLVLASSCDDFFLRWSLINMKSNMTLTMATFVMSHSLRWQLFLMLAALPRVLVRSAGLVYVLLVLVDVYFLVDCVSPRSLATRTCWFENAAYTN